MAFEIRSTIEILQKGSYDNFSDIEDVFVIANNMLITSEDDTWWYLQKSDDQTEECGVKFNSLKSTVTNNTL